MILKAIEKYFRNRKSYVIAQQDQTMDVDSLSHAAGEYRRDMSAPAEHWLYLRHLLESGKLHSSFIIGNYRLFSSRFLLTFDDGAFLEKHGKQVIYSSSRYDGPLTKNYLTPEYKFQYLADEKHISHARYTTEAGTVIDVYPLLREKNGFTTFTHEDGVASVIHRDIRSFEVFQNHIYLNEHKSKFELLLSDKDTNMLSPLVLFMNGLCRTNSERDSRVSRKSSPTSSTTTSNEGTNPWAAGAIGLAAGTLIGSAIADDG